MTAQSIRFSTTLLQTGKTTTGIEVPPDIVGQLGGGARPAVSARVNDYSYRTTIGVMGGKSLLPFSADHRAASGLNGGDAIEVELSLDTAPRTIDLPADLDQAMSDPTVRAGFLKQAPSRRKADIENVLGAKSAEARERRIAAIVARFRP